MGFGRIFSRVGRQGIFPKYIQGEPKVVKRVFSHSVLKKQHFFAYILKIQAGQGPPAPQPGLHRIIKDLDKLKLYGVKSAFLT